MKSFKSYFVFLFLVLAWCSRTHAAGGLDGLVDSGNEFLPVAEAYKVDIVVDDSNMLVNWTIAPGYYLYKEKFRVSANTSDGSENLPAQYETGEVKFDEYFQKDLETFRDFTQVKVPVASLPNQFELKLRSQGCADAGLCYAPRTQYFQIDKSAGTAVETDGSQMGGGGLATTTADTAAAGALSGAPAAASKALWVYLLLAIGGGLILNLMPCVFPVLSLKAISFAQTGGSSQSHHMHGWAYTAGVVGSFIVVALIIFAARAAGQSAGWGFQLQSPAFVAAMTYLFLVMGLSLSGVVHFGTSMMGVGQGLTANDGLRGSFFTGVLAAVVASPCTGPMMAPALGFALTQPAYISVLVFIALGFGMALPFLALSYSPKLAQMLPRPGTWMEKLKEFLAFPMYITSAWLLFVFGRQVGMVGVFFLVLSAIAIAFAIWLHNNLPTHPYWRRAMQGCALLAVGFAGYVAYSSEDFRNQTSDWQPYSKELVSDLRAQGQPVFADFTADWCITCKANESVALSRDGFKEAVKKHNFALVKGDWTNQDPKITAVLNEFQRVGVPLYLVYPADPSKTPEVLPQLLTQDLVIRALERATQ